MRWPWSKKAPTITKSSTQVIGSEGWFPWNAWQRDVGVCSDVSCPTVAACVDAYAQTLASLPVAHEQIQEDGSKKQRLRSRVNRTLQKPNSYQTRSDFFLNLTSELMRHGEAFALAGRNGQYLIDSMHLIPGSGTAPYVDQETQEVFYGLGTNPLLGQIDAMVPARDVLHIRLYTSGHPLIGEAPIKNCLLARQANQAIAKQQATFFGNSSRPNGFISVKREHVDDPPLSQQQIEQLRNAWETHAVGFNAGQVPVMNGSMTWTPLTITSQDAQLAEAFHMTVEEIARAFRVPMPLVGDNRNSTYNNVEQLLSSWLATGLGFVMEHVELALAKFFMLPEDECIQFDTENLLRTDFKGKIDALSQGVLNGIYSPNEARKKLGLPAVDQGDDPRVQQQVVPLSAWSVKPTPAVEPTPDSVP